MCFSATGATFTTYNAQINALALTGAPSSSAVPLTIVGEGFITGLSGGRCAFARTDTGAVTHTSLITTSNVSAVCSSPAGGVTATYAAAVQLNGVADEPNLLGTPYFADYDLTQIQLSKLVPAGGPTRVSTSVTVHGSGFASYGAGQLVCRAGSTTVAGELLSGTQILCPLPESASVGPLAVAISLNGGSVGTYTMPIYYAVYTQPTLTTINPTQGNAEGGTLVTVTGSGFTALSSGLTALRCRFGSVSAEETTPDFISETEIHCPTVWGAESATGEPVSVTLNGLSFTPELGAPRFLFVGLHAPALVDVYFSQDATKLIVQFDSQQTNRGGANGNVACDSLLLDATATQLKGEAAAQADCGWESDTKLIVYLTLDTAAAPGMLVQLRPSTIWPRSWTGTCAPGTATNLCNSADSRAVDSFFPCDVRNTTETREECVSPVAVLQAPTEINSCPDTALELDGSQSTGGGIKLLNYTWRPTTQSDNYYEIKGLLDVAAAQQLVTLPARLAATAAHPDGQRVLEGAETVVVLLLVSNFLGASSEPVRVTIQRAGTPIPTIRIAGEASGVRTPSLPS